MGIRDLTINASSIFDIHEPLIEHIKNGVVTQIECNYMGGKVGKAISQGIMENPGDLPHPRRPGRRYGKGSVPD